MKKFVRMVLMSSQLILFLSLCGCQAETKPFVLQETSRGLQPVCKNPTPKEPPEEKISITRHAIKVNGEVLNYTAMAGCLPIRDETGKVKADLFFTSYVVKDIPPELYQLMSLYPQPVKHQPSVEYLPVPRFKGPAPKS
jgi:carboxypeptidase C (cathepsin A)